MGTTPVHIAEVRPQMNTRKILLLGGGGHAKCVIEAIRAGKKYLPFGVLDRKERVGASVLGVEIVGVDDELQEFYERGVKLCFVALGSTSDPARRIALWKLAEKVGFEFPSIIHSSAVIASDSDIGRGVYIGPGAIVNPGVTIGDGCIINSGAIVEHDCHIGEFVHVAPGTVLSGGVTVGARTHLGTGCSVTHGVKIGTDSIIGVAAVVIKDIPSSVVCVGNPAKTIRNR